MAYFMKYWWSFAARGVLLLIIGIIAVTAPNMPLETLVFYLGFLSAAMGAVYFILAQQAKSNQKNWLNLGVFGLLDLFLAYFCLFRTELAAGIFLAIIALWAVFMGVALVVMATTQKGIGRTMLLLNGVLSLAFAGFVFFNPLQTTSVNFMVGFYAILLSLLLMYLSFRMFMLQRSALKASGE